jgi:oligoribonuclease (3'-5' exoribonuclease)
MPTNFMQAGTEIDGLVSKLDDIVTKAANEVAEACIDRARAGKAGNSLETDVANLVKDFPIELQNKIYLKTIMVITKNIGGSRNPHQRPNNGRSNNNIFANRGF